VTGVANPTRRQDGIMLDDTQVSRAPTRSDDWTGRARAALAGCGRELADAVAPGTDARDMQVFPHKVGATTLGLRLQVGERAAFLKVFDGDTADIEDDYIRERSVLLSLRGSGLVPGVLAYSNPKRFLLMSHVGADSPSGSPADALDRLSPEDLAFRIGTWLARFEAFAPSKPATGNWYQYLRKFGAAVPLHRIESAFDALSEIPLCGLVIARNDAALHNYLIRADGHLVGCDFEKARMRPRGWDYMMTFHALIQRFPEQAEVALEAYVEGFSRAHRGALIVDELNVAARQLFCARALSGRTDEETI
jgi:Phosphotransferase enzyme family